MNNLTDLTSAEKFIHLAEFSLLIDRIYEGATDPAQWPEILAEISQWVGAPKATLFTPMALPDASGFMFSHNISPMTLELWRTEYRDDDLWVRAGRERNFFVSGNIATGEDLVPRNVLLASRWYREFLHRAHLGQLLTGIIFGFETSSMMPVVCSFYRSMEVRNFGEDERNRLALLMPHLSRALGVMQRLRQADLTIAASMSALNRLPHGVLLIAENGKIVFANTAAKGMLEAGDGLHITPHSRTLSCEHWAGQKAIAEALCATLLRTSLPTHFARAVSIARNTAFPPYLLQFSRLANGAEFGKGSEVPIAIIFITDNAAEIGIDDELFSITYQLSKAELRVAKAYAKISTVSDIAAKLHLSPNTIKSHLKHIYVKMNIASRAEFIRILLAMNVG